MKSGIINNTVLDLQCFEIFMYFKAFVINHLECKCSLDKEIAQLWTKVSNLGINSETSNIIPINMGVPQGSGVGSHLL